MWQSRTLVDRFIQFIFSFVIKALFVVHQAQITSCVVFEERLFQRLAKVLLGPYKVVIINPSTSSVKIYDGL
jgi:hypothetical protein